MPFVRVGDSGVYRTCDSNLWDRGTKDDQPDGDPARPLTGLCAANLSIGESDRNFTKLEADGISNDVQVIFMVHGTPLNRSVAKRNFIRFRSDAVSLSGSGRGERPSYRIPGTGSGSLRLITRRADQHQERIG